jgi:hypothetical protein
MTIFEIVTITAGVFLVAAPILATLVTVDVTFES